MANEPIITVVGNVAGDPELRFTQSGKAVCGFTVASTPRTKGQNGEWEDGTTTWLRCSAWDALAENVAESIQKGHRVIVQGALSTREYEHNGENRTSLELRVDAIGPELRWATARVTKTTGQGGGNRGQGGGQQTRGRQDDPWGGDPWASPSGNSSDEPPF